MKNLLLTFLLLSPFLVYNANERHGSKVINIDSLTLMTDCKATIDKKNYQKFVYLNYILFTEQLVAYAAKKEPLPKKDCCIL